VSELLTFIAVGALAQLIDGALGMAYGVTSAGLLMALGMPPVAASASVHYAETFTCGASGISHLLAGNVRRPLFFALVLPGVLGALLGVLVAINVPAAWMRMILTPYLVGMGLFLLLRSSRPAGQRTDVPPGTRLVGLVAGLVDAIGGGRLERIDGYHPDGARLATPRGDRQRASGQVRGQHRCQRELPADHRHQPRQRGDRPDRRGRRRGSVWCGFRSTHSRPSRHGTGRFRRARPGPAQHAPVFRLTRTGVAHCR
jgi:hypothetical protein